MTAIEKLIAVAQAEIGYLEKKSNKDLDDKTANAGSSNYTKYNRDMKAWAGSADINDQWCQNFVDWLFVTAFGLETAKKLLGTFTNYTPTGSNAFKKRNAYIKRGSGKPKVGDVIYFYSTSKGRIGHVGIVYKVGSSTVYTIEGNTSGASTLVTNGGGVRQKSYKLTSTYIDGYGRPDYTQVGDGLVTVPIAPQASHQLGDRLLALTSPYMEGEDVKALQAALNALGFDCGEVDGEFGPDTDKGVRAFQTAADIEVDGEFGPESLAALRRRQAAQTLSPAQTVNVYPVHNSIPNISAHDDSINVDAFCAAHDFAILRARVKGKTDEKFKAWATALQAQGFPFAVYDYLCLKTEADAIAQADAMFTVSHPFAPRVYYLDTEKLADGMTYEQEHALIKVYVQRLRDWGVEIIGQYASDSHWRNHYRSIESLFDTLWIANWGSDNGSPEGITLKSEAYTDKIDLHQFTSKGTNVPGVNHKNVDLNRLTGKRPLSFFTGRIHEGDPLPAPPPR